VRRTPLPVRVAGRIFVTGLLTLLPLVLTVYFTVWLITVLERFFGKQVKMLLPDWWYQPGMGLIVAIALIFGVGLLMHAWLFRRIFRRASSIPNHCPLSTSGNCLVMPLLGGHSRLKVLLTIPAGSTSCSTAQA